MDVNNKIVINYLILPLKRTGSCGIMEILDRKASNPTFPMSTPSIIILPDSNSVSLRRARNKELECNYSVKYQCDSSGVKHTFFHFLFYQQYRRVLQLLSPHQLPAIRTQSLHGISS